MKPNPGYRRMFAIGLNPESASRSSLSKSGSSCVQGRRKFRCKTYDKRSVPSPCSGHSGRLKALSTVTGFVLLISGPFPVTCWNGAGNPASSAELHGHNVFWAHVREGPKERPILWCLTSPKLGVKAQISRFAKVWSSRCVCIVFLDQLGPAPTSPCLSPLLFPRTFDLMFYNPSVAPPQLQRVMPAGWGPQPSFQNFQKPAAFRQADYTPPNLMDQMVHVPRSPLPQSQLRRYSANGPEALNKRPQPLANVNQQGSQPPRRNSKGNPRKQYSNPRSNTASRSNSYNMQNTNSFNKRPANFSPGLVQSVQSTYNFHPGMKDIPIWLKGLRLHKYTKLFEEMTYDQMMRLNESALEKKQVTKGARRKILQSLEKLKDRSQLIRQLEKCIDENGDVRCLIVELRSMMNTPIAAYEPAVMPRPSNYMIDAIGIFGDEIPDENLPGHIARVTVRLHEYLFRNGQPQLKNLDFEEEYFIKLFQTYDRILTNEAFTMRQKCCVNECKRVLLRFTQEKKALSSRFNSSTPIRRDSDQMHSDDSGMACTPPSHTLISPSRSPEVERNLCRSAPSSPLPQNSPSPDTHTQPNTNLNLGYAAQNLWYNTDSSCSSSTSYNSNIQPPTAFNSPKRVPCLQAKECELSEKDKNTLLRLLDNNPGLYNYLLNQLPRYQQTYNNVQQPPQQKYPARVMSYMYSDFKTEPEIQMGGPLTAAEKLRFIADSADSPDALNRALNAAMGQLNRDSYSDYNPKKTDPRVVQPDAPWQRPQPPHHVQECHLPYLEKSSEDSLASALRALSMSRGAESKPPQSLYDPWRSTTGFGDLLSGQEPSLRASDVPSKPVQPMDNPLHRLLNGADSFYTTSSNRPTTLNSVEDPFHTQSGSNGSLFQAFRPLACHGAVH
ncbi:unnamed protein product [Bursaphelenchus xylophilus]|uniref:(pine wood nematode) hypothetical protein n=1 Tax=Bursaphelenchus xylophilus TaxID=6326 RepID=A0A1I7RNW5_BURXY|nr:unnamed protein product [Bursaphelenchus xylophilus]CAG9124344.1 unnamed protein product [Bursaphelenchus xylophilus]